MRKKVGVIVLQKPLILGKRSIFSLFKLKAKGACFGAILLHPPLLSYRPRSLVASRTFPHDVLSITDTMSQGNIFSPTCFVISVSIIIHHSQAVALWHLNFLLPLISWCKEITMLYLWPTERSQNCLNLDPPSLSQNTD